jgi:hypothetical protein
MPLFFTVGAIVAGFWAVRRQLQHDRMLLTAQTRSRAARQLASALLTHIERHKLDGILNAITQARRCLVAMSEQTSFFCPYKKWTTRFTSHIKFSPSSTPRPWLQARGRFPNPGVRCSYHTDATSKNLP